jgi:hypothetical protein
MSDVLSNEQMRQRVSELEKTMQCSCNLDRWEPNPRTGHTNVCPISKAAYATQPVR